MRILMVHSFHHARGGDTTYTRALTRGLLARGHEVRPLAMRHPDNEPSTAEVRFPRWIDPRSGSRLRDRLADTATSIWSIEAALTARGLARDMAPEIVHIQHLHRHLTPSILPPLRRVGAAVLWTLHDYELVCPSGLLFTEGAPCERCLGHRYSEAIRHRCKWGELLPSVAVAVEKSVHRLAGLWRLVDRYLCPSKALADTMVRFGVPHDRVEHLPNFVEVSPSPAPLPEGEGWLVAGRLTEEKGVHIAIEAARRLPDQPLWICGDGPWRARLEQKARGIPWIRFLGHRPQEEIAALLRQVRFAAVPSIWPENFPYAITEAQAAGRPVVASAIGGIPEMIDHEVDGLLVPAGQPQALVEAVRGLLEQPERATRLGLAGQRRVRERLKPSSHLEAVELHYFQVRALRASRP